ncbi:hypothetical protein [uncultured Psychroserpens sp.]|uniref:hypothetical protein n=2 Tax=uncultured Psychroserpens sp. TaxID=255436 RepID=UPI00260BF691|nr:hypothetical protein [uncultured Psychroserpens sp.]
MKYYILIVLLSINFIHAQQEQKMSSMDFVQIQNDHVDEVMHYYNNNWKVLRIEAIEKGYIDSFQILENVYSEEAPFHLILITTYKNKMQFDHREKHFRELIDAKGPLNLLNNKKPAEFRKILFGTDAKHLN